ncbi:MAG: hypothetical protein NTY74_14075 [Ignavibacteriae bacterium]|nr:hypothetical protein [Ignavibacteriota bacterium]
MEYGNKSSRKSFERILQVIIIVIIISTLVSIASAANDYSLFKDNEVINVVFEANNLGRNIIEKSHSPNKTTNTITSTTTGGNWDNPLTWVGNVVPGANDDVIIDGLVNVTGNSCNNITINSGDTLQNRLLFNCNNDWFTLTVNGNITNNGIIKNYDVFVCNGWGNTERDKLILNVKGNITNNGIWVPEVTNITGNTTQTITSTQDKVYQGSFYLQDSTITVAAGTDLRFFSLDMQYGKMYLNGKSLINSGVINGKIENGKINNSSIANITFTGKMDFQNGKLNQVTCNGRANIFGKVGVDNGVIFKDSLIVIDTLQCILWNNCADDWFTLTVNGVILNNGVIKNQDPFACNGWGAYENDKLAINAKGNIINNGIWAAGTTRLIGNPDQTIHSAPNKNYQGAFYLLDSTTIVNAGTDLSFVNLNLQYGKINMGGKALTNSAVIYGTINNSKIYNSSVYNITLTGGVDFFNGALGQIICNSKANIYGVVNIDNGVTFNDTLIIIDTLRCRLWNNCADDIFTMTVNGVILNNGVIKNQDPYACNGWGAYENDKLAINSTKNIINNKSWNIYDTKLTFKKLELKTIRLYNPSSNNIIIDTIYINGQNMGNFNVTTGNTNVVIPPFGNYSITTQFNSTDTLEKYATLNIISNNIGSLNHITLYGKVNTSKILVTTPNGGENLIVGIPTNITWTSSEVQNAKIELTTNNGSSWSTIVSGYPALLRSYAWTVPNYISTACKIRISDVLNPSINDLSNNTFSITNLILGNGLIAYYPFEGNGNDYSGNGNNGIIVNNCTFDEGILGTGVRTYGSDVYNQGSYVKLPSFNFQTRQNFTISMWVKEESMAHPHGDAYFWSGFHDIGWLGIGHFMDSLRFAVGGTLWQNTIAYPFDNTDLNKFVFYSMVYDNGIMKAYKNATLIGTKASSVNIFYKDSTALNKIWWGNFNTMNQAVSRLNGVFDEVRIYNRSLTLTEIQQLYNQVPNLSLLYPNGGENIQAGDFKYITWNYGEVNQVILEYTTNNGTNWIPIETLPASTKQYFWNVPEVNSNQCKVRISNQNDPTMNDVSNNTFTIKPQNNTNVALNFKIFDPFNSVRKVRIISFAIGKITDSEHFNLDTLKKDVNLTSNSVSILFNELIPIVNPREVTNYGINYYKQIRRIELIDQSENIVGHINYKYTIDDIIATLRKEAIIYVDPDMTAGTVGKGANPGWEYYRNNNEKLVSMLVPPNNLFDNINYNNSPTLFVHGVSAFFPAWDFSILSTVNNSGYDCWQFYYPYDQNIVYSGIQLRKVIDKILMSGGPIGTGTYNSAGVNIVAHSMGGLVTRSYIQSNQYTNNIKKFLMLGTPNHGSFSAYNQVHGFFWGELGEIIGKDKEAPAYRDLSISSNFIYEINSNDIKPLFTGSSNYKTYLVIAGTSDQIKFVVDEIFKQEDGVVAVSSAGLLDRNIPLGTLDLKHTELTKNISPNIIINFLDQNYNPVNASNTEYNNLINNLLAFWLNENDKRKFDYGGWNYFNESSGITCFKFNGINYDNNFVVSQKLFNPNKYYFTVSTHEGNNPVLTKSVDNTAYFSLINSNPKQIGIDFNDNGTKSFVIRNFIDMRYLYGTEKNFYFKRLQTNLYTYELSSLDKSLLDAKGWLSGIFSKLNKQLNLSSNQFYIDNSLDSVLFYLSCEEGDTAFTNNNFTLKTPSNIVIDSVYASTHSNITYTKNPDYAYVSFFVRNPEQGNWTVQYNSNLKKTKVIAPINSNIYASIILKDSTFSVNDSVSFEIPLPKPINYTNINFSSTLDYMLSENDSAITLGSINIVQKNDSTYGGKFKPLSKGIYTVNLTFTCNTTTDNITRKTAENIFVTGLREPTLKYPPQDTNNLPVNLTLKWNRSVLSTNYRLQVFKNSDTSATIDLNNISDTTYNVVGLTNTAQYIWRVLAFNNSDTSKFSGFSSFSVIESKPMAPILIEPPTNSAGFTNPLTFKWNRDLNASKYILEIAEDSLFSTFVSKDTVLIDTSKTYLSFQNYQTYYWRVKAINTGGESEFSEKWNFKMLGAPYSINLLYPTNNALNLPVNLSFKWERIQDQILIKNKKQEKTYLNYHYWFEIVTDTLLLSNLQKDTSLVDTTKNLVALLDDTTYYWRVKGYNNAGWGNFSNWNKFSTIVAAPNVPTLSSPINYSVGNVVSPTLVWRKTFKSNSYTLQLSTDSTFNNILIMDSTLTDTMRNVTGLQPLTKHYWRVKAKNIGGESEYSNTYNFKTKGIPNTVNLYYPQRNGQNIDTALNFVWFKPNDITNYKNSIKNNKNDKKTSTITKTINKIDNFSQIYWFELVRDTLTLQGLVSDTTVADTLKSIAGLSRLTNYYWRVKSKNDIGWNDFSQWSKFTTVLPAPLSPVYFAPQNNSTGQELSFNFVWNKSLTAIKYQLQVSSDSSFSSYAVNDSTLTDSLKYVSGLAPLTNYYWRLRAFNAGGWSAFGSAWKFKTLGQPTQVQLYQPGNNSVNQPTTLSFIWRRAIDQTFLDRGVETINKGESTERRVKSSKEESGINQKDKKESNTNIASDSPNSVSNYWFELATDSMFVSTVVRDSSLSDTTKLVSSLTNSTNYYWRVKGKNQVGWAPFSTIWKFTTVQNVPIAPTLTLPLNNSNEISLTPTLTWGVISGAASYRIQVSTDSLFATTQFDTSGVTSLTVNIPTGKLTGLTKYYWRVNASNAGGTSIWSNVWNFRTLQNLTLNLKLYLEGFWDGVTQVSDTTMIYLANSTNFTFVDSAKIVLSTTGTALVNFTKAPNGSYYIVVNHRNHLETWSTVGQFFVTNIMVNYDFTTAANKAFGNNMKQVGSVWVLYGGDANRDGSVDALDVILVVNQFGTQGYLEADFNGDQDINGNDIIVFVPNFGMTKIVPSLIVSPVLKNKDYDISRIGNKQKVMEQKKQTNIIPEKNDKGPKTKKNN